MAWNRGSGEQGQPAKKAAPPSKVRGLVAGIAVVAIAGIGAWFFLRGDKSADAQEDARRRGRIKEVTPAAAPKATPEKPHVPTEEELHPGMVKSSTGVWHPKGIPYLASWKKPHAVITNNAALKYESAAECGTDQILLQIFSRKRGDMPMPLPAALPDWDVEKMGEILINKLTIDEAKDSDEMKRQKTVLNEVKEEMRKFVKDGGTVEEFIMNYHEELERCYFKKFDYQVYLNEMQQKGEDPKLIHEMAKKLNEKLMAEGIEDGVSDPTDIEDEEEGETK